MIAVLVAAMWTFFRSQLSAAIVIIIVGAVLLAIITPGLMESVGKSFLNLLGGGS
jgi:K+-transporting ATPase c subunit